MRPAVCVLFILAITVNVLTLKNGHNWGDDFAQYIINARNIIEGKPFMSGVMLDGNVVYPPGLPLLIAPALKVFGLNFKVLKLLNIFCWYLAVFFLYRLFSRTVGRNFALAVSVFLAFSSYFFVYKQNVLSDVPFFLFVCLSLYTLESWKDSASPKQGRLFFTGFLLSMSCALWTRSAGIALFAAALFFFFFIRRDNRAMASVVAVFAANELLLFSWMGCHPGFFTMLWQRPDVFLWSVADNFATVFRSLWWFFCPYQTVFSGCLFTELDPLVFWAAPFLYLIMAVSFIYSLWKKQLSYLECFSFFYISMLIVEEGFSQPPDAFTRFVLPLLPFVFFAGSRLLFRPAARAVFLVLLLINVTNMAINWDFNDDVFNVPANIELISWIKQNVKPDERFMFFKPRALALLTGRQGTAPWIFPDQKEHFIQRVRDFKISYVFADKDNDPGGLTAQLEKSSEFKLVWQNAAFEVFHVQ